MHKPAGLLVHRSPIDRHATGFALQYARELNGGEHVFPCHRLDRPTSGLLLFARNQKLHRVWRIGHKTPDQGSTARS